MGVSLGFDNGFHSDILLVGSEGVGGRSTVQEGRGKTVQLLLDLLRQVRKKVGVEH